MNLKKYLHFTLYNICADDIVDFTECVFLACGIADLVVIEASPVLVVIILVQQLRVSLESAHVT